MTTDRRCPICHKPLTRGPRETERDFRGRQFCGHPCAARSQAASFDALLRPKADRRKPIPKPPCLICGKEVTTAKSTYCSIGCANRDRPRPEPGRQTQTEQAPPKPRMATQRLCGPKPEPTGTHLTTIPKKKKAMPTIDAGLCVHAAKPIWFADGAAVIAGLVATLPLCSRIVAGWFATVPSDADGYVTPRFTTAETAALFDQMVDNKTGRRAA